MSNEHLSPSPAPLDAATTEALILAIDTSSPTASFAIVNGEALLASLTSSVKVPHSRTFYDHLNTLLKLAGCSLNDIEAFAAATGPGSFTGLRVGLAAIKGLAHTLGKPAIGVNSIDALALAAGVSGLALVLINAGRNEVYHGLRLINADGGVENYWQDAVGMVKESVAARLQLRAAQGSMPDQPLLIVGDGALSHKDEIMSWAAELAIGLRLVARFDHHSSAWQLKTSVPNTAEEIARQGGRLLRAGQSPGLHPHYIRPSDAEIKFGR